MLPFKIKFEYSKGVKSALVDIMSTLIKCSSQIQLEPEISGYDFCYYSFESLLEIETTNWSGDTVKGEIKIINP